MGITAFFILVFIPAAQSICSGTTCTSCVSGNILFLQCRWCEISRSCHLISSPFNYCKSCEDSSISKLCSVKEASKCDSDTSKSKNGKFEPLEAFNAALYSAIAYSDEPSKCAKILFPNDSFEIVEYIGRRCNYIFEYKECFAYVAVSHDMKIILLAYRGTTSTSQLVDEVLTIIAKSKVSQVGGGRVQEYFSNANDQLYPCVEACMKDIVSKYPSYRVLITGHSLGGAIASIASTQLSFYQLINKDTTTLYTFGMPRTGDIPYAKIHDELIPNSWRLVHFKDIVVKLPARKSSPSSPYHHQREIFYGKQMNVTTDYIECFNYEDSECANSVSLSLSSIDYHKVYYGLPIGSYCDNKMKKRRKRSDEPSALSHLFTNETCRRINVSDITSGSPDEYAAKTMGIMFSLLVLERLFKVI